MKIVDRYLIGEIMGPFSLAVIGFIVIGIADVVFVLADSLINKQVPLLAVLKLLVLKIPDVLVIFFPMAVLFAVMLVLIRLAKDNEITIFRAQGINIHRILLPIVLLACVFSLFSYLNNEFVVPWSNHHSNNIIRQGLLREPLLALREQVFFKDKENRVFYIDSISEDKSVLENVMVFEQNMNYPKVISARTANSGNGIWQLHNGIVHDYDQSGALTREMSFDNMTIRLDNDVSAYYTDQKSPREMNSREILARIALFAKSGTKVQDLEIEYYLKQSAPFSCAIFALIGIALCVALVKTSKDWWGVVSASIIAALATGFFITLTAVFRALGRGAFVSPWPAAWGANLIFAVFAIALILRKAND
ncbi:MAG: LptF/LptG family permease [Candidatus Margulisiibacteriota bacterium]|jgi:LPS export ABC transporter permease LptF